MASRIACRVACWFVSTFIYGSCFEKPNLGLVRVSFMANASLTAPSRVGQTGKSHRLGSDSSPLGLSTAVGAVIDFLAGAYSSMPINSARLVWAAHQLLHTSSDTTRARTHCRNIRWSPNENTGILCTCRSGRAYGTSPRPDSQLHTDTGQLSMSACRWGHWS